MGKGKSKRDAKRRKSQEQKRLVKIKMGKPVYFTLTHCVKKLNGICNKYNYKANMHGLIFKDAIFNNVKYQASIITKCNFNNSKLTGVDFFNSNLKSSSFKGATLSDVVFYNCNLKDADFQDAQFKKVCFVSTNTTVAKNLNLNETCNVYKTYPKISMNSDVEKELLLLSNINAIYQSRIIHVDKNKLNRWCIKILVDSYGYETYRALMALKSKRDKRHLFTIFAYKKHIERYLKL